VLIFGQVGISFAAFSDGMKMFGSGSVIYTIIRAQDIVMAIVIVLFTTVIAALYPAIKAARIKPLEALNHI
jgi:putative ABC transport system permease protein